MYKRFTNLALYIILSLFITSPIFAGEVLTGFSEDNLPVLNEELRRLQHKMDQITTPDEKVKTDSSDTTAGYLSNSIDNSTIKVNTTSHELYVYVPALNITSNIANVTAGTTYIESYANTTRSTNSLTPVKVKEFSPLTRGGAYNIYFALNSTSVDYIASARIYKNGIAVGGLRNQTGTVVYQAFNEDISGLSNGDVLSIYANTTGGPGESANVKDVWLRCTNPILMQEASGY